MYYMKIDIHTYILCCNNAVYTKVIKLIIIIIKLSWVLFTAKKTPIVPAIFTMFYSSLLFKITYTKNVYIRTLY